MESCAADADDHRDGRHCEDDDPSAEEPERPGDLEDRHEQGEADDDFGQAPQRTRVPRQERRTHPMRGEGQSGDGDDQRESTERVRRAGYELEAARESMGVSEQQPGDLVEVWSNVGVHKRSVAQPRFRSGATVYCSASSISLFTYVYRRLDDWMIEFRIDPRSGVAPYRQLVQQVRQALRLGLLSEGDRLPTVKEVVAQVAINPNTVLKAYRELEHEGLATGRPGLGTFVTRSLTDASLAAHTRLRRELVQLARRRAPRRPRRREHRGTVRECVSRRRGGGRRMTAVATMSLGKRYGRRWALRECTLAIPEGRVVGLVGANGAGKSTLLHLAVGLITPTEGAITTCGGRPGRVANNSRGSGSWPRTRRCTRRCRWRTISDSAASSIRSGTTSSRRVGSSGSAFLRPNAPDGSRAGSVRNWH